MDSDWAMLCSSPMSAYDLGEDRQPRSVGGGHAQPGLVHEGQQAEGLEGHRLATGVRAGDDQGAVAEPLAQAQVDGHRVRAEQRVAGGQELERVIGHRRSNRVHLRPEVGSRHPQVGSGECRQGGGERLRMALDLPRQRLDDPLLLGRGLEGGLRPGVVQLDDSQRLDVQGRGRRALIVDDARHAALGLGPDRNHVPTCALGDDRVPDRTGQFRRAEHAVQPLAEPLLGHPHPAPSRLQRGGGAVENLPAGIDAPLDLCLQGGHRDELFPHARPAGAPSSGTGGAGTGRGREGCRPRPAAPPATAGRRAAPA